LIASALLALSRLSFNKGRIDLKFIGFFNYQQLLFGLERSHFLGVLKSPTPIGWAILTASGVLTVVAWVRTVRSGRVRLVGLALRLVGGILLVGFIGLLVQTLAS